MIREESGEFGIVTVAWPLLWACLRECSWEEAGTPSTLLSITFPFEALLDYTSPKKRRHVMNPLPSCTEPLWWLSVHLLIGSYLNWLAVLVEASQMLGI
jgi:hypothetical protein